MRSRCHHCKGTGAVWLESTSWDEPPSSDVCVACEHQWCRTWHDDGARHLVGRCP